MGSREGGWHRILEFRRRRPHKAARSPTAKAAMTVSLDFIAAQLQRVLDELQQVKADIAALRREVEQQRDETVVVSGMVMRYAGEHIAWGAMQNEIRKLRERLDAIERGAR
jgi:Mg2+ and Co2+ transporter CorA